MTKACPSCHKRKDVSEFGMRTVNGRRYLNPRCKRCRYEALRVWRQTPDGKESDKRRRRKARHKVKEAIRTIKSGPCLDCGRQYPYYVMEFDHLEDKLFTVSQAGGRVLSKVIEEIRKCDLVCSNCHKIREYERRTNGA